MEHVSRRTFLKAAAGAALAAGSGGLLSGCGTGGSQGATVSNFNTGAKRTLEFWAFSTSRTPWQKKAWELYKQQKKPDFDLRFMVFPFQQMHDKVMITAQAGSGGPDIADIEIGQFSRFIKGEPIFVDLTPKLQQGGLLDKMYRPSATDPWSWNGKIYGVGNELNTVLLSYRWDIWEQAGVKAPIETWEDFAEQAKKYNRDTGKYLFDIQWDAWAQWWILTLQQGAGFFSPEGKPTLPTPEGIRSLAFQKSALADGWAITRPVGQAEYAALSAGEIATVLGPSWRFSGFVRANVKQTAGKWMLQPMPRWTADGSRTATAGGTGVTVLRTSPMLEEAVDFVVWEHTTPEALMFDFAERQVWPTWRPAFEDPRLSQPIEFFNNQKVGELISEISPEINKWYNSPFWGETTDAAVRLGITPALQEANLTPEAALKAAQQESEELIQFQTA